MNAEEAVKSWRDFANSTRFEWDGSHRTWAEHIKNGRGYRDEEEIIQPVVFPRFAHALLAYDVGLNLAPERSGREGKPDFTPADAVSHSFVFETKSTAEGVKLEGHDSQVQRYLEEGRPRIERVALTNLVGIRVFELTPSGDLHQIYSVNLRGLLEGGSTAQVASVPDARKLLRFLDEFSFEQLDPTQKLERVREQPDWNPLIEVTDGQWISARLDKAVRALTRDVIDQIDAGRLEDDTLVLPNERRRIAEELQELEWRLGTNIEEAHTHDLDDYLGARSGSAKDKAVSQFAAHTAYYTATKLLLVRIWEDLRLLDPVLYDGGFDQWMDRLDDVVDDVVDHSYAQARKRYRSLFDRPTNYDWYRPARDVYAEVIYQLANTYLGEIESDVLGGVYERLLERVDRKLLGQYYTPRDIIGLIWDLMDESLIDSIIDDRGDVPRVIDIATGSGGFLVEAAQRVRQAMAEREEAGADVDRQWWITSLATALSGIEIQRFPAFLAEINLLIQVGQLIERDTQLRLPPLGILNTDTLSLHNPIAWFTGDDVTDLDAGMLRSNPDLAERAGKIRDPLENSFLQDVACGNPPYIGEKKASSLINRTKERFEYWQRFAGHHMDYLYWFLILGVSKLRKGGKFGFITTEYWLRAVGAKPLRKYLARRCSVDRIILFRDFRLFPDAPGQHSMICIGERRVEADGRFQPESSDPGTSYPTVSIYRGENPRDRRARKLILDAMRDGRSAQNVDTFDAPRSPNALGERSWSEVVLTPSQVERREAIRKDSELLEVDPDEGIVTGAAKMRSGYDEHLTSSTLDEIDWPESRHGILILTDAELRDVAQLGGQGGLTEEEKNILWRAINTKDVYPYASVLPNAGEYILRLFDSRNGDSGGSGGIALHRPFPPNMPNVERHLRRFRPLLQRKVENYGEEDSRPWWSIHRPKEYIESRGTGAEGWADYCVTKRWGAGESLVVGLAPADAAPKSGIYALLARRGVPAAYVSGILNATAIQELAETLPPGVIRSQDLEEIGVPFLPKRADYIASKSVELANLVRGMVNGDSQTFPQLAEQLRSGPAMLSPDWQCWIPEQGPRTSWGELENLNWVDRIESSGGTARVIRDVSIQHEFFGTGIRAVGNSSASITVVLSTSNSEVADALHAYLWGIQEVGGELRDIPTLLAPIHETALVERLASDRSDLRAKLDRYKKLRNEIDAVVDAAI